MKHLLTLLAALLLAAPALAQTGPVGQSPNNTINQTTFDANTDSVGFSEHSLTPALVVASTATTQALASALVARTTHITTCSATTGPKLPSVQRNVRIQLLNRSGGSCLIWPTLGATLETALGTDAAANASFTMLTNTNIAFCPITATRWVQCQ